MKINKVSFDKALALIQRGEVVAIPTETVYGLAGSATHPKALTRIFHIKKRPLFNPLIVHCGSAQHMNEFHLTKHQLLQEMIQAFCPGPVTFILRKTQKVSSLVTAGHQKVGLRIPRHPLTLKLIQKSGLALCAPSANIYGGLSPTSAEHVEDIFKGQVPILDGGPSAIGIESTVLEPNFEKKQLKIARPGGLSQEKLSQWLAAKKFQGWEVVLSPSAASPGQSSRHYQPQVPLVLITINQYPGHLEDRQIVQKQVSLFPNKIWKELKLNNSPAAAARKLYHQLRQLSKNPNHIIYVYKTPALSEGLWLAIWERLHKACSRHIDETKRERKEPDK